MRLKWKIFFSMLAVVLMTFSLGATVLISATFQENLAREEANAADENRLLRASIGAMFASVSKDSWSRPNWVLKEMMREKLVLPESMPQIRIWQEEKILYEETIRSMAAVNWGEVYPEEDEILQKLQSDGKNWWVQTVSSMDVDGEPLYLESWRDISDIYANRESQYYVYRWMVLAATAVTIVVSFLVASWLANPIGYLSQVSRSIAEGNLEERADIVQKDELGSLAVDINYMADALQEDIRSLQETNERQERFIGNFAHELKTPLTSIIGYADLLQMKETEPAFVREAAGYIFQEGKRLEQLSARLLEIVLLRQSQLEKEKINMERFLEQIDSVLRPVLSEKEITLHREVEPDVFVLGEAILLETVVLNLADNARKACSQGGNVWMRVRKDAGQVIFEVEDDGRGASESELGRLTEAFYMADKSRSRREGGAGLGLAICAEILKLHEAKMKFESSPGKGMKITMVFREGEQE